MKENYTKVFPIIDHGKLSLNHNSNPNSIWSNMEFLILHPNRTKNLNTKIIYCPHFKKRKSFIHLKKSVLKVVYSLLVAYYLCPV